MVEFAFAHSNGNWYSIGTRGTKIPSTGFQLYFKSRLTIKWWPNGKATEGSPNREHTCRCGLLSYTGISTQGWCAYLHAGSHCIGHRTNSNNTSMSWSSEPSGLDYKISLRDEQSSHRHMSVVREEGMTSFRSYSGGLECFGKPSVQEGSNSQDRIEPLTRLLQTGSFMPGENHMWTYLPSGINMKLVMFISPIFFGRSPGKWTALSKIGMSCTLTRILQQVW